MSTPPLPPTFTRCSVCGLTLFCTDLQVPGPHGWPVHKGCGLANHSPLAKLRALVEASQMRPTISEAASGTPRTLKVHKARYHVAELGPELLAVVERFCAQGTECAEHYDDRVAGCEACGDLRARDALLAKLEGQP